MKLTKHFITIIFFLFMFSRCIKHKNADLIVHNAKIYTVDNAFTVAEAMAIKDGKIVEVGKEHDIRNKYTSEKEYDAKTQPIYPGFIDAHCHFLHYGLGLNEVDLTGTRSFNEVLNRLRSYHKKNPNKDWIIGRGWDQNDWQNKEYPDKGQLDSLFPNNPVFITRVDGHAALANSVALKEADINAN
ncbi:MAG: amidohydrolase family protein, partial [Flavobacteriales bacterium]